MHIDHGYSEWKYSRERVAERTQEVVTAVQELMGKEKVGFDAVVLTGSSGTWLGGALQADTRWPESVRIVLCRKCGENSHGALFEGARGNVYRALLVDDFVDSGATARRVAEALFARGAALVGVLEHARIGGNRPLRRRPDSEKLGIPIYRRHDAFGE